jgi:hypothetical protein
MSDHPKVRSAVNAVTMTLVFIVSLFVWMHGCDLSSLWIEVPLLVCLLLILPGWARRATSIGSLVPRSALTVIVALGLIMGYLSLLHSDHFPRWLLFPKSRMHRRVPKKPPAGNAGIVSHLSIGHHWPGVPEPERSATPIT